MEANPGPWISALRHSHDRLRAAVEPLSLDQLEQRSYASEWSVAQVLSHLGSQAEIFSLFLDSGLTGQDPPGREQFEPIWASWNGKDPQAQASAALRADQATLELFESLDMDQRARLQLKLFGMELDTTGLARMRLSEHAIHASDVWSRSTRPPRCPPMRLPCSSTRWTSSRREAASRTGSRASARVHHRPGAPVHPGDGRGGHAHAVGQRGHPRAGPVRAAAARRGVHPAALRADGRGAHPPAENAGVELDELRPLFPGF